MTTASITFHEGKEIPLVNSATEYSPYYLVLIRTPSQVYWGIARYSTMYRKTKPWRTETNHGVDVIVYYNLPEIPDEFNCR